MGKTPYKVEILPEPVIPTGHHSTYHHAVQPIYPHHQHHQYTDPSDPYEPFAENEADFQPSTFPLAIQGAVHQSSSQPEVREAEGATKLEILEGNQHKSVDAREPSLTFTSPGHSVPRPTNHSVSIQVHKADKQNVVPQRAIHTTVNKSFFILQIGIKWIFSSNL